MDADQVGNLLSPSLAAAAGAAFTVTLAQAGNQLLLERAAWHEVERIVDGFVRDVAVSVIRKHTFQCAGYLLWWPVLAQQVDHQFEQLTIEVQLRATSRPTAGQSGSVSSETSVIRDVRPDRVACQFS